jgi:hypothetical protein
MGRTGVDGFIERFESVGDNCEFGFLQQHHHHEAGGLLRWALLGSSEALIRGIQTRFAGMFAFENLVPAGGGTMVFDTKAGIAFHTQMRSSETGGTWQFDLSEAERRVIHAEEAGKMAYLVEKFFTTLAEGRKILVFKQNRIVPRPVAEAILAAVSTYGECSLLFVDPQGPGETAGTVERLSERLYRGVIDRFAPYEQANDISVACWTAICEAAAALHLARLAA